MVRQVEKTDGPIMSVEDALILLDVMPVVVGFDDDEPLLERYRAAVQTLRDEAHYNKTLVQQRNRMESEVFAWRVCWALFGAFLVGVLVLTAIF